MKISCPSCNPWDSRELADQGKISKGMTKTINLEKIPKELALGASLKDPFNKKEDL